MPTTHRTRAAPGSDAGSPVPATPPTAPRVSVVIPAKDEARNLPAVLAELPPGLHEVILVDGESVDGTVRAARRARPDIVVVHQTRHGKGNALACGIAACTGDVVVTLDADGSADPAEIPAFVEALVGGADFAKGSRFLPGGGSSDLTPLRRAGNDALVFVMNRLYRTRFTDLCYGYNACWRDCVDRLGLPPVDGSEPTAGDGFEIETLLATHVSTARLSVVEVPSYERDRRVGQSHLHTWRDGWRVLRTILRERHAVEPAPLPPRAAPRVEATQVATMQVAPSQIAAPQVAAARLAAGQVTAPKVAATQIAATASADRVAKLPEPAPQVAATVSADRAAKLP